jgi:hypothetical protein
MDVRRTLTWFFSIDSEDLSIESGYEARSTRIWALMVAALITATLFLFRPPFSDSPIWERSLGTTQERQCSEQPRYSGRGS